MRWCALIVIGLAACSSSSSGGPSTNKPSSGCASNEITQSDGTCFAPGVAATSCGSGFTSDRHAGCNPVLPSAACGEGQLAVPGDTACAQVGPADPPTCGAGQIALPGETACHDLGDCGTAPWGGIPVDATTQYVDASYPNADSDGTQGKPWKAIGAAITAASAGGVVAVAAGSYHESVTLPRAVKLWGRCAKMVEIVSSGASGVKVAAAPTEIHGIAVTGAGEGVVIGIGASPIVLDHVWLHDLGGSGLDAQGGFTLTSSLIDHATDLGIWASGVVATIDSTIVRGMQPVANTSGLGIQIDAGANVRLHSVVVESCHVIGTIFKEADGTVDTIVVRDMLPDVASGGYGEAIEVVALASSSHKQSITHALVERVSNAGFFLRGSANVTIDDALVRDVKAVGGKGGAGLQAQMEGTAKRGPNVSVHRSLFERTVAAGVNMAGATVGLDQSSVRDIAGFGVLATPTAAGVRPSATVTGSLVERCRTAGIQLEGADAQVTATLVRDTVVDQAGFGFGIEMVEYGKGGSTLTLDGSVLDGNRTSGILVAGSTATITNSVIRHTQADPSGSYGDGIALVAGDVTGAGSTLTVSGSVLADNGQCGVVAVTGTITMDATLVTGTRADGSGAFGDGISVVDGDSVTVTNTLIAASARAGVSGFGTDVTIDTSRFDCNAIALDRESGVTTMNDGSYSLSSADLCGCSTDAAQAAGPCQVLSSVLAPPPALKTGK